MKTVYTTFSSKAWRHFKLIFPRKTEEEFVRMSFRCYLASTSLGGFARNAAFLDANADFLWYFRTLDHYFLEPGIAQFCVDSCPNLDSHEIIKRLPKCDRVKSAPRSKEIGWLNVEVETQPGTMQGGFAVHFPIGERQRSIIVIPDMVIPVWQSWSFALYHFGVTDAEDCAIVSKLAKKNSEFKEGEPGVDLIRLVLGLGLYMDAFPDAVVPSKGEDILNAKHYKGSRVRVRRSAILDEEDKARVSPHWRRGHFRLLSSAVFTRKAGQTVWVRGTYVRGHAYDVKDDAPPLSRTERN